MSKKIPVKVYWKEPPPEQNQVKNSFSFTKNNPPGEIINSKYAKANAKIYAKNCIEQSTENKNLKNFIKNDFVKPNVTSSQQHVTLQDLCKDDKRKITNLIQELAKFGKEKENAVSKLNEATTEFEKKLKLLKDDNHKYLQTEQFLKEQIDFYENKVQMLEKEKYFLKAEQMKLVQNENNESTPFYVLGAEEQTRNETRSDDILSNKSSDESSYAQVFIAQQKKFEMQQKALQEQIIQLQDLQGSIMKSNFVGQLRETDNKSSLETSADHQAGNQPIPNPDFENSKKLEKYLLTAMEESKNKLTNKEDYKNNANNKKDICLQTEFITSNKSINAYQTMSDEVSKNFQPSLLKPKKVSDNKISSHIGKYQTHYNDNDNESSEESDDIDLIQESYKSKPRFTSHIKTAKYTRSVKNPVSPLKRRHFEPSSLLLMPEYIPPPSTSTSVDHYSLKQHGINKHDECVFTSTRNNSVKLNQPKTNKLHRNCKSKKTVSFDDEEREILHDVFFIR